MKILHRLLLFPLLSALLFISFYATETFAAPNRHDHVSVQLDWKFQFEYAGFIAAVEKGFYREAGLDVKLLEYQAGIDTVSKVLNHEVNYGIHNASLVITGERFSPSYCLQHTTSDRHWSLSPHPR